MPKNFVAPHEWWTENNKWGPWHLPGAKTVQKKSCYDVLYESNEYGSRDHSFKLDHSNNIILLGDSFAEGYGVNLNNTSQKYIEELTGFNVLNFGVSKNFGPVQYSIIYNEFAKEFKHDKVIIYFLPDNDFGENDYSNWGNSKRYRPYFKKIDPDLYETFIPENAVKNYSSFTRKIKRNFQNYFWTSNLFINLNYQYKIYRSSKKNKKTDLSPYFNAPLYQQKAAIYFINKIIDNSTADVILVSIPRLNDYLDYQKNPAINKTYWNEYFVKKDLNNNKFKFVDLITYKPNNLNEIYLKCDGHWSPKGNLWAAQIISNYLN